MEKEPRPLLFHASPRHSPLFPVFLISLFLLIFSLPVAAKTLYVDGAAGNDATTWAANGPSNPWRSDRHAGTSVTFDGLPLGSTVKLFTVSGRHVKTLTPAVTSATWDLANDKGDKVASGIYVYLITVGNSGDKARGKVVVIK